LRTPLNSIVGWSEILSHDVVGEEETKQAIDIIYRNARAQVQLIDDLLDMSRVITGNFRIEPGPVSAEALIRDAIASVRYAAQTKDIGLKVKIDPEADRIYGDAERIRQVFWNLLANAIKFTPSGGTVTVLARKVEANVEVSVVDTGEGIDTNFLPHVFDRFR